MLEIKSLSKSYGRKKALENVELTIEEGKIVGLLGPNGSGKTTFMKILSGMIKKYKGEVYVYGEKPGVNTREYISYLPDVNHLYKWMKVSDCIKFYEDMFQDFDKEKINQLIEFLILNIPLNSSIWLGENMYCNTGEYFT